MKHYRNKHKRFPYKKIFYEKKVFDYYKELRKSHPDESWKLLRMIAIYKKVGYKYGNVGFMSFDYTYWNLCRSKDIKSIRKSIKLKLHRMDIEFFTVKEKMEAYRRIVDSYISNMRVDIYRRVVSPTIYETLNLR